MAVILTSNGILQLCLKQSCTFLHPTLLDTSTLCRWRLKLIFQYAHSKLMWDGQLWFNGLLSSAVLFTESVTNLSDTAVLHILLPAQHTCDRCYSHVTAVQRMIHHPNNICSAFHGADKWCIATDGLQSLTGCTK